MQTFRPTAVLYTLLMLSSTVLAADLGTKPFIRISGDPSLATSGPSWVRTAVSAGSGFAQNSISLSYFFEVAGPGGFIPVPVEVDFLFAGAASEGAISRSSLQVITNGTSGPTRSSGSTLGNYHVEDSLDLVVNTNAAYQVVLVAIAGSNGKPNASAWAFTDPRIKLDENWVASHPGYAVNVTPGVLNQIASPIPEPSTASLMVVSLSIGLIRLSRFDKRRAQA